MNYKKSLLYPFLLCLSMTSITFSSYTLHSKAIIWDLGRTLFKPHQWSILKEIGLGDFLLYPLFSRKNPHEIQNMAFTVLRALTCPHSPLNSYNLAPATDKGALLPLAFRGWLAGYYSNQEILQDAYLKIAEFDAHGYFSNKREKRLVTKTLEFMFTPSKFALHMKPIGQALKVLSDCYNTGAHEMFILSNWDPESFSYLYHSHHGQKVFQYFKPENIVISGDINIIKPDPKAFKYMLKTYNLKPEDCILIDDEIINIDIARTLGITGIHLQKGNYTQLRSELKRLHIIN